MVEVNFYLPVTEFETKRNQWKVIDNFVKLKQEKMENLQKRIVLWHRHLEEIKKARREERCLSSFSCTDISLEQEMKESKTKYHGKMYQIGINNTGKNIQKVQVGAENLTK